MTRATLWTIVLVVVIPKSLLAQNTRIERITFAPEETSTSVSSTITGYNSVAYVLETTGRQSVSIVLESDNLGNYFNIFEPGKLPGEDYAIFIGSTEGNRFKGKLHTEGDYTVQVYLIRSAARRGETAHYTLELSISTDSECCGRRYGQ